MSRAAVQGDGSGLSVRSFVRTTSTCVSWLLLIQCFALAITPRLWMPSITGPTIVAPSVGSCKCVWGVLVLQVVGSPSKAPLEWSKACSSEGVDSLALR